MLSSLVNYYELLSKKGLVVEECFSEVDVSWLICLNEDGTVDDIFKYTDEVIVTDKKGKQKTREIPKKRTFPKHDEAPAVRSENIEHRGEYIFGFDSSSATEQGFTITAQSSAKHQKFIEKNLEFTKGIDTPIVSAYRAFIENWVPEQHLSEPILLKHGKNILKGKFAFCLTGKPNELLNDNPEILNRGRAVYEASKGSGKNMAQCCITGEVKEIAKLHEKIKGIVGGQTSGNVFVCYNNSSEESYCKTNSFNSNISQDAMIKYTTAMNHLLADRAHREILDEMTLIYWADSADDDIQSGFFSKAFFNKSMDKTEVDEMLNSAFKQFVQGKTISEVLPDIDENVSFYILGMTPNASRVSVKLYCKDTFGNIMKNMAQHQKDLKISENNRPISVNQILRELKSPKSTKDKVPSPLISDIFRSILYGTVYPEQLLSTVVRRVKTDSDEENNSFIKINSTRAGIIKACLNRKARFNGDKEEIKMALDKTNQSEAYLCGRLFAQLEKIQKAASGGTLNTTIKDSYFASACSTPALVFPRLIKLAQNHLKKINSTMPGYAYNLNSYMGDVINMLGNNFPKHLSLTQQGEFILGYYQELYYKDESKTKEQDKNQDNN